MFIRKGKQNLTPTRKTQTLSVSGLNKDFDAGSTQTARKGVKKQGLKPSNNMNKMQDGLPRMKTMNLLDDRISPLRVSESNSSFIRNSKSPKLSYKLHNKSTFHASDANSKLSSQDDGKPETARMKYLLSTQRFHQQNPDINVRQQQRKEYQHSVVKKDIFDSNGSDTSEQELSKFKGESLQTFMLKFQYFCAIIFFLNFMKLGCENFAYLRIQRCISSILMAIVLQLCKISQINYQGLIILENSNKIAITTFISSQVFFLELLAFNSDHLCLAFGLISMTQCGNHLLNLSTFNFNQKFFISFSSYAYIVVRIILKPFNSDQIIKVDEIQQMFGGLCFEPLAFFALIILTIHVNQYENSKQEFFVKQLDKVRREFQIWQYVNQKTTIGMCLFNLQTNQIEHHNEALAEMLGLTPTCKPENSILRPKKKKIHTASQECLLKKYDEKELHKQQIMIDKSPKTLRDVITDVLNCLYIDQQNNFVQDYLNRYNIVETNKNIVITARNIQFNSVDYSIIIFDQIDKIQKFEYQKQLERFDKQFTSCLAHDLLTPVNHIMGINHMINQSIKSKMVNKKDLSNSIQIQHSAIEQMHCMINDMLDLGHLRSNTFKFKNQTFELKQLTEKIVDCLIVQSKMKGISLKMKIDEDVPSKITSDPDRLKQIIMNLVGNAIKYTKKGYIYLHVKVDHTYQNVGNDKDWLRLEISVRDTGIGISEEGIQKIFKLFGQVKSTKKINQTGIGLGLAICKSIVQQFMGEIFVDTRVGKGSKFTFKILVQKVQDQNNLTVSDFSQKTAKIKKKIQKFNRQMSNILEQQTMENKIDNNEIQSDDMNQDISLIKENVSENNWERRAQNENDCNFDISVHENDLEINFNKTSIYGEEPSFFAKILKNQSMLNHGILIEQTHLIGQRRMSFNLATRQSLGIGVPLYQLKQYTKSIDIDQPQQYQCHDSPIESHIFERITHLNSYPINKHFYPQGQLSPSQTTVEFMNNDKKQDLSPNKMLQRNLMQRDMDVGKLIKLKQLCPQQQNQVFKNQPYQKEMSSLTSNLSSESALMYKNKQIEIRKTSTFMGVRSQEDDESSDSSCSRARREEIAIFNMQLQQHDRLPHMNRSNSNKVVKRSQLMDERRHNIDFTH